MIWSESQKNYRYFEEGWRGRSWTALWICVCIFSFTTAVLYKIWKSCTANSLNILFIVTTLIGTFQYSKFNRWKIFSNFIRWKKWQTISCIIKSYLLIFSMRFKISNVCCPRKRGGGEGFSCGNGEVVRGFFCFFFSVLV